MKCLPSELHLHMCAAAHDLLLLLPSGYLLQQISFPALQSDIFSFGVVLWEIVTGGFATRGRLHPAVVPEQCPQTIADLISACMRVCPAGSPCPSCNQRDTMCRMSVVAHLLSVPRANVQCVSVS
jgi:hypothetical protein